MTVKQICGYDRRISSPDETIVRGMCRYALKTYAKRRETTEETRWRKKERSDLEMLLRWIRRCLKSNGNPVKPGVHLQHSLIIEQILEG